MPISHLFLALLLVAIWGFNYVIIEVGLEGVPPIFFAFLRFFLASLPWVFFIKKPKTSFRMILLYGLVMFALQFALLFMGMYAGIAPGLASVVLQLQVFFTILLGVIIFKEKPHSWQIIGALVAFAGIALVGMKMGQEVPIWGFLLLNCSSLSWAFGNVISKKLGNVDMISVVVWGSLVAWPPLLLLSFFVEGPQQILTSMQQLNWISIGAVLYITYLSTLFGFGTWSWLIHRHPLGTIAPFTLLVPIIAIVCSIYVLDEPFQTWKVWAAVLTISGLCINFLGPRLFPKKIRK